MKNKDDIQDMAEGLAEAIADHFKYHTFVDTYAKCTYNFKIGSRAIKVTATISNINDKIKENED